MVLPTKRKPRRFRSRLMASDTGVLAGISFMLRQAFRIGLLSSALARPKNRRAYGKSSSIFDLAAVYGTAMVRNHPFIDGNKRVP